MDIVIGKFRIISDRNQFTVLTDRPKGSFPGVYEAKEGETTEEVVGYYSEFRMALKAIPTKAMLRSEATSLKEVLAELKMYRQLILKLAEGA